MDADACIAAINGFIEIDDFEQRRGLIYGLTPGITDYPYQINLRREYFSVIMYYAVQYLNYHDMIKEACKKVPHTIIGKVRLRTLESSHEDMRTYGREVWDKKEHMTSKAHHHPVYTPEVREAFDEKDPS